MTATEIFLESLKYVAPAGMVLAGVYMVMRENRQKIETKAKYEIFKGSLNTIIPLRLQAYERALLFLERISPESLYMRVEGRDRPFKAYQLQMVAEIRAEFEHNLAQQLYIDGDSWAALVGAKEQTISMIHQVASKLPEQARGGDLGKALLNEMVRQENIPTRDAIRLLKTDVSRMFRFATANN